MKGVKRDELGSGRELQYSGFFKNFQQKMRETILRFNKTFYSFI